MKSRPKVASFIGMVILLTASMTVYAGSSTQSGSVNGMSCTAYVATSSIIATATTKSVPANSSYIYVRVTAYMYPNGVQKTVTDSSVSYSGTMAVAATVNGSSIHHARGVHVVDSWTVETVTTP